MPKKTKRRILDADNPEWTAADFKRARFRPSREVVPHIVKALFAPARTPTIGRGREGASDTALDPAVIAHFKRTGAGWQTRVNDTLAKAIARKR